VAKKPIPKPAKASKPAPNDTGDLDPIEEGVKTILPQGERPIQYPEEAATYRDTRHPQNGGPLSCQEMKDLLGWETEAEWRLRENKPNGKFKDEWVLLKDEAGERVVCWNNFGNRPFREREARGYGQDILNRVWAGPHNYPGETVNGESVIIGRTGRCISVQHRGVGFVLACQQWAGIGATAGKPSQAAYWAGKWPEEPFFECLLVTGVSEAPEIVATIDNVIPRSEADMIETSPMFASLKPRDKHECSRMLAKAFDLLWSRTRADENDTGKRSQRHGIRTQGTAMSWINNHATHLKPSVKHIFAQNLETKDPDDPDRKVRALSLLNLSPGECAGMLYLMGSGSTDEVDANKYRGLDPREEKGLDWDSFAKAKQFWSELARDSKPLKAVRLALTDLAKGEDGVEPARATHKHQVIARAWQMYLDGEAITKEALQLVYQKDTEGIERLADETTFGGIDRGPKIGRASGGDDTPAPEIVEAVEGEKTKTVAQKLLDKAEASKAAKEAAAKGPSGSVAEAGAPGGKPPSPKLLPVPANKRLTQKEVNAQQTARAAADDAQDAAANGTPATPAAKKPPRPARKPAKV